MLGTFRAELAFLFCLSVPLAIAPGLKAETLPDAPTPQQSQQPPTPPQHVPVPAIRPSNDAAVVHRHWSSVVEPGEKVPALTVHDKLMFAAHEEIRWSTLIPITYSGAYGVLTNSDPKLGTNADDFGKRVGYAAARQAIQRELSDSLLPIAFHEDPRYYRMAYGSYYARTWHAARRIFITQTDSGKKTFDYSDFLGRGAEAALTQTYYPARSQNAEVVFSSWGLSLLGLGVGNVVDEFWPDVRHKFFHLDN